MSSACWLRVENHAATLTDEGGAGVSDDLAGASDIFDQRMVSGQNRAQGDGELRRS